MIIEPEGWEGSKRILVILAHPDDPEFFCGATLARWTRAGHEVIYHILTKGDKGSPDRSLSGKELSMIRVQEQKRAAEILGVKQVEFEDFKDGYLIPDLSLRKDIVRIIRSQKPDVIVTSDPTNYFPNEASINHPDHRAAGQVVTEAVFPAAGNFRFFPELEEEEGLLPHSVKEVWYSLTSQPNISIDVTDTWEFKRLALHEHKSQIGDPEKLDERLLSRRTPESTQESPRFEEKFRRFKFG